MLLLLSPLLSVVGWTSSADAVPACTIYWTGGAGDHAWSNTGNWSTNRLSDGTDSAPLPGETARVCVADNPVSRGAVILESVTLESVTFPGVDDDLQVGSQERGGGVELALLSTGLSRTSNLRGVRLEGGVLSSDQPVTIRGDMTTVDGGTFSVRGLGIGRIVGDLTATQGALLGNITLSGDTTFSTLWAVGVTNRGVMRAGPGSETFFGDPAAEPAIENVNRGRIVSNAEPASNLYLRGVRNVGSVESLAGTTYLTTEPGLRDGVLSGGVYAALGGDIDFPARVFVNRSRLRTRTGGTFTTDNGYSSALRALAENRGTLDLATDLTSSSDFENYGTVALHSSTLMVPTYTQRGVGSVTNLLARAVIDGDTLMTGGTLWANGSILGDFTSWSDSTTKVQVRPTGLDRLTVSGRASLAGTLSVDTTAGAQLDLSKQPRFLTAGSRLGEYRTRGGNVPFYDVQYRTDGALLVRQQTAQLTSVEGGPVAQGSTATLTLRGVDLVPFTNVMYSVAGINASLIEYADDARSIRVTLKVASTVPAGPVTVSTSSPAGKASCVGCLMIVTPASSRSS